MHYTTPSARTSRFSERVSFGFLFWMFALAVLASASGVAYAVLKYNQVAVRTEIDKLNREIAVCRMNANQYRAKTNALTNRWAMRDRLSQDGSTLQDIRHSQIEIARSVQSDSRTKSTVAR